MKKIVTKIASLFLVAFVAATALLACSKSSSTSKSTSSKVDVSKFGGVCKNKFNCPQTSFDSSCKVECEKVPGAESGYCQFQNIVTAPNTSCLGNRRGTVRESRPPKEKTPVLNYCDMNAGVFCSETHVCEPVKPVGTACKSDEECGLDGTCAKSVCVAAGEPGAAAVEGRCNSKAYRAGEQCIAHKADGEKCDEMEQCKSLSCGGTCNASKPEVCELK
jgi:hypothetical protein